MRRGLTVPVVSLVATVGLALTPSRAPTAAERFWQKPELRGVPRWTGPASDRPFGEFLVDTAIAWSPGPGTMPAVTWGGGYWLAVWHDNAQSPTGTVYAARLDADGALVDTAPIYLADAATNPSVAFDGAQFLVVWQREVGRSEFDVYGARVTVDGAVLDSGGFAVSARPACSEEHPAVAFGGGNFLVAWEDGRNSATTEVDVYAALVTGSAQVLPDFPVSNGDGWQTRPRLSYGDTCFLAVWEDGRVRQGAIYGARVTRSGVVLDPYGLPLNESPFQQSAPAVAFGADAFLVAWARFDSVNYVFRVRGTRVRSDGTVLDSASLSLAVTSQGEGQPTIAFDGTNWLVAWIGRPVGGSDIFGTRITAQGVLVDTTALRIAIAPNVQEFPCVAWSGAGYFAVWSDMRSPSYLVSVYGARVTAGGAVPDSTGIFVSMGANAQSLSAAAFDGTNYLVVWQDYRGGGEADIYGIRLDAAGRPVDQASFPIVTAPGYQGEAAVAFDGANFLVVWQDGRSGAQAVYGARVSPAGVVLDSAGRRLFWIAGDYMLPVVAFNGTNYLVSWTDYATGGYPNVRVGRVTPSLVVLDSGGIAVPPDTVAPLRTYSSVSSDGANWLVVWTDGHDNLNPDVWGTRVAPDGALLDSSGFAIGRGLYSQVSPAVGFDGTHYLVAWTDTRGLDTVVYAARVTSSGTVLDPSGIRVGGRVDFQPRPIIEVWDGNVWVLAWARAGLVGGARLLPSGVVMDTFTIINSGQAYYSDIVRGSGDDLLLTFTAWAQSAGQRHIGTSRVWGKLGPFPGITEPGPGPAAAARLLTVLPNPTADEAEIVAAGARQVSIYDATGRLERRVALERGRARVAGLPAGVHLVLAGPGAGTAKLVVRQRVQ